jgi:hypothetical protein
MSTDRREFLGQVAAVTAGLGAGGLTLTAQRAAIMPTARASALMALFGPRNHAAHLIALRVCERLHT